MGLYTYITETDRINMRKVKDINVNELFQEALKHDKSLMITERVEMIKKGLFKKPKEISYFTVYHETPALGGSVYQARIQSSASGSKSIVVAYLYGIINGALSVKNDKYAKKTTLQIITKMNKLIAKIRSTKDYENLKERLGKELGTLIYQLVDEADKTDRELDIVYTKEEVDDLLDRNTAETTAQVLNKFKNTYSKEELRKILLNFAPFVWYDTKEGNWTHIVDNWIKENL